MNDRMGSSVAALRGEAAQEENTVSSGTHPCDVLVAGSGAGGFATALTALRHGLDVLMVEKDTVFGGTTAYSAGVIWIPGNAHLPPDARRTDARAARDYLAHHVGNRLDASRIDAFLEAGPRMLALFESEGFVAFSPAPTWADYHPTEPGGSNGGRSLVPDVYDGRRLGEWFGRLRPPVKTMMAFGGMMVGRNDVPHLFRMTSSWRSAAHVAGLVARYGRDRLSYPRGTRLVNGNGLIARMARHALDRGMPLWLSSPIVELTREDGRVTGAVVERQGRKTTITARCGVVLATGGFPSNDEMTKRLYDHRAAGKNHTHLPPASNTGDGARIAAAAGGYLSEDVHHPAAWTPVSLVPQPDGTEIPFPHFIDRGKPGVIAIDRRGNRFANEALSYHEFVPAMVEACRGNQTIEAWIVCDHSAIRRFGLGAVGPSPVRLGPFLESGYLKEGMSIRALAAECGISAEGLAATIGHFNAHAAKGIDPDFARGEDAYQRFNGWPDQKPNPCLAPLATAPFYAVRVVPGELGTFAGIATNAAAQVVDRDGRAVAGLYAVGNDALSVMGGTYPGAGITIGPAMTFGFIAANHMAGERRGGGS
jgi:succinate dehydrogenase/fumarate reductase flavoprotein subunit